MKLIIWIVVGLSLSVVSGSVFAARYNPHQYYSGMTQNNVLLGHVIAMQPVRGSTGPANLGGVLGGVAGLALGSKVGEGAGRTIATIGGAILGSIFGSRMEQRMSSQPVMQITVRLQDGRIIAVVEREFQFQPGQEVQVIYSPGSWNQHGTVRVLPL
jgi:outer membrane lipoprotein SlyB